MATRASRFTQTDLTRAVKGVVAGGVRVGRIEIDPNGKIVILPESAAPAGTGSSWDDVLR